MKVLISMVNFVLNENSTNDYNHTLERILNYAEFLNTPLNIGMFVPAVQVGNKWVALEKPKYPKQGSYEALMTDVSVFRNLDKKMDQYQKAKDNVLFEGFEIYNTPRNSHGFSVINEINGLRINFSLNQIPKYPFQTIQDLIKYKPTLTKKGLEVSGLDR